MERDQIVEQLLEQIFVERADSLRAELLLELNVVQRQIAIVDLVNINLFDVFKSTDAFHEVSVGEGCTRQEKNLPILQRMFDEVDRVCRLIEMFDWLQKLTELVFQTLVVARISAETFVQADECHFTHRKTTFDSLSENARTRPAFVTVSLIGREKDRPWQLVNERKDLIIRCLSFVLCQRTISIRETVDALTSVRKIFYWTRGAKRVNNYWNICRRI